MNQPLLVLLTASLVVLAACDRPSTGVAEFPGDTARIKAAADAAARTAQAVTQKLGETYGTNQPINVHVQVGDIVVLGFDEGVDAEEWGMTEISNEGGVAGAGAKSASVTADQAAAAQENAKSPARLICARARSTSLQPRNPKAWGKTRLSNPLAPPRRSSPRVALPS